MLNGIMKGFEISFEEAKQHPTYRAYIADMQAQAKKEEAQLAPSRGSRPIDAGLKANMTEEEHRKLWAERSQ